MHCKICGGEGHNKTTCKSTDLNGGSNGEGELIADGGSNADGVSSSRGGSSARSGTKNRSGSSARSGTKTRGGSSSRPTGMGVSFNQDGQPMLGNSFGVTTPARPHGINPSDLVQQVDVIPNFESQPQTESPP